ncbi:DUF4115 domain-containing protein [Streptosporangium sp. KLBMP 9127]|nr:DUF4115 domain-containing protein [Streptosporangium sp. KLBMP 9127]
MGRHRSDPMGIARLALAGLVILALVALIAVGVRALFNSLDSAATPAATPSAVVPPASAPQQSVRPSTLLVECRQEQCPKVFVRIPGGDVLLDREMAMGERATFDDEKLDVVLTDGSAVHIEVNGESRPPGSTGEREAFVATREP